MSKQTYLTFAKVSNYATVIYIFKTNLTHVSYITWDKLIATIIFSYFPKNWESKIKLGRNNPHKTSFFLKVLPIRAFSPQNFF